MPAEILVIEDVRAVLFSLRIILTGAGHRVTCAADGIAGLDLLKKHQFDLVISDIWMPGMSGTDVIAQGRRLAPRASITVVIFVSDEISERRPDVHVARGTMQ